MHFFDYKSVAQEARIPDDALGALQRIMRDEFPADEMMADLHVLRACMAIRDGRITLDEALESPPVAKP